MPIEFSCSQCSRPLRVPDASAGKMARCPGCQAINKIPDASSDPGLGSLGSALPSAGLPSAGLPGSFDPPATDPFSPPSALPQPAPPAWLPNAGAFAPISHNPTPVPGSNYPVAGNLGTSNPFADGAPREPKPAGPISFGDAAANPYASPYSIPQHLLSSSQGLPWDLEVGPSSWFETLKLILLEMNDAFRRMKPDGGYLGPLGFYMVCACISLVVNMIFQGGWTALQMGAQGGQGNGQELIYTLIGYVVIMAAGLILSPLFCFIAAAFLHGSLMVVGGANRGYETTFRLTAYSFGTMTIVGMIPCVGGCVVLVWGLACLINALLEAHRCTTGQAVGAVVISFVGYVVLIVGFVMSIVALVAFAAAAG
ncbi:YIP1 family protein [Anatilimnocola sp. NA78]|uniref:YIP1 family protein n=1 Tax=Anatilimnocola sp. NA78 TaxID=3415683 RepID=UPI003CE48606